MSGAKSLGITHKGMLKNGFTAGDIIDSRFVSTSPGR